VIAMPRATRTTLELLCCRLDWSAPSFVCVGPSAAVPAEAIDAGWHGDRIGHGERELRDFRRRRW